MKKKLQKAATGLQKIQADQNATRSLLTGAVSAGAEAALPGLGGTLVSGSQVLSGMTRNEDGLYKNKVAQTLDGLNPVTQLTRLGNAASGIFSGKLFRDGVHFDLDGQQALKDAKANDLLKQQQAATWGRTGLDTASKSQLSQYKKGAKQVPTKPIEMEGDEAHFSKKVNGKRILKTFLPDGPSHEEGGIPILAEKGDAIVTAKGDKGKEAVAAHLAGNDQKVEKLINQMPMDKGKQKAKNGLERVKFKPGSPVLPDDIFAEKPTSLATRMAVIGRGYLDAPVAKVASKKAEVPSTVPTRLGSAATSLAQAAPTIFNLGQGLFGDVEKTTRRGYTPTLATYADSSAPSRLQSTQAMRASMQAARNYSGGNAGNARANSVQAFAEDATRQGAINNQEASRKLQVNEYNTGLLNDAVLRNNAMNDSADALDMQNAAKKSEALASGLTGLSALSSNNQLMKNQAAADEQNMGYLKQLYKNYTIGPDGKIVLKARKGVKKVK